MDCSAKNGWSKLVQLLIDAEADLEPRDIANVSATTDDWYTVPETSPTLLLFISFIYVYSTIR